MRILVLLAGILATFAVSAQEQLRFGSGITHNTDSESTYGWELGYAQRLGQHAGLSLDWLNEGHQENSHRDGIAAQIWARAHVLDPRLSLAVGIGPYLYFNTSRDEAHPYYAPYANDHGLKPIYSAEIAWTINHRWLIYLRANRIAAREQINTSMLLLGLGYQFDGQSGPESGANPAAPSAAESPQRSALTLFLGHASLNSFALEGSTAYALEYRRSLSYYSDWSLGWLDEGGNRIIRRNGITTELWLMHPFWHERLELGIGAGAYLIANQQNQLPDSDSDDERLAGIITLTGSYSLDPHWFIRLSFNRIVTHDNRDSDVILFGGGYRF